MTTPTATTSPPQAGRALPFAAGCVFLAGTCGILFEDLLIRAAPLALKHGLTLAVLAGTILAGHLAHQAGRARHIMAAAGFGLVFVAGTALVIYSSVGRQAADTIQTTAQIAEDAKRRLEISAARARSATMLEGAQRDLAAECKTGAGKRCQGIQATIDVYTAAIAGHDAALAKLGPARVASPDAEQFAEIVHVVTGADKAKVKAAAVLLAPFLVALFLEFGAVIAFGYAFRVAPSDTRSARRPEGAGDSLQTDYPAGGDLGNVVALFSAQPDNKPDNPGPSGGQKSPHGPNRPAPSAPGMKPDNKPASTPDGRKDRVIASILTSLAAGRTFPRQADLCEQFGVPRSTMSDWLGEWEEAGLIPARRTVGRCKALSVARADCDFAQPAGTRVSAG